MCLLKLITGIIVISEIKLFLASDGLIRIDANPSDLVKTHDKFQPRPVIAQKSYVRFVS